MLFSEVKPVALLALAGVAQAYTYKTRFEGVTWDDKNWILKSTKLDQGHYESRMSLANGYMGINVANNGPFFDVDTPVNGDDIQGWPLFDRRQTFATVAGFFDSQPTTNGTNFGWLNQYGGESVISGVPHWAGLVVQVDNDILDANVPSHQISNFSTSLDIRHATMYWQYTWTPSRGDPIRISYSMFVHKLYVNMAVVQLQMTSEKNTKATVVDVLQGDCAVRTTPQDKGYDSSRSMIYSGVSPTELRNISAYFASTLVGESSSSYGATKRVTTSSIIGGNSSSIGQSYAVSLSAGKTTTISKYIGGASSDAYNTPKSTAVKASMTAAKMGYDKLHASHVKEWMSIMPADSVDNFRYANGKLPDDLNVQERQITAITNPFQLVQNTIGDNAVTAAGNNSRLQINSISVCGLGSSCYAGLVFWDVEVWMQPGLVVAFPQATRQIAKYRVDRFPQAQANVLTAYQSSENQTGRFSPDGAIYSWTSGRYGNCTGTGPCWDYEYHINGDIGLELYNYWIATGDTPYFKEELFPVYEAIAQMYADLATYNKTSGLYGILNATDPDEYANFQNNVGYTLVLMGSHINNTNDIRQRFGMEPNEKWANISSLLTIPVNHNADIILEYAAQNGSLVVKQADIVLIDDFLDFPNPYTLSDLEYYAAAQSNDGPAMTYGVFSVVSNRNAESGCASYTYDLYGSQPYLRAPWYQFSEQLVDDASQNGGTHPAFPFLTGVGGANRVAVFGYLGLRLKPDTLEINPSLPPQILTLEYRTIYWQGWAIKAKSNQTHTTLTRLNKHLPEANMTFAKTSIPVTISLRGTKVYTLSFSKSLTVPNRAFAGVKTVPGNIAQCRDVSSDQLYEPGQFPLSAVDGTISTKWQPSQANKTSSLTVSLPEPFVPITSIHFDWAQSPPTSYRVTFHNSSSSSSGKVVASSNNIAVSNPYNPKIVDIIRPYMSNTTNVTLSTPVWSGKYATLEIHGNQLLKGSNDISNGTGASVAEWSLVAMNGKKML